jgi:prepilin-type processing-associated H-X9-DG protein
MTAAQSYHIGGVNTVFCDGSVWFISETIDNGNLVWSGTITAAQRIKNKFVSFYSIVEAIILR